MSSDNNKGLAQSIQVNGLTWAKTLMICAILVCAGVAAYFGANVSVNVNLADRVSAIEHTLEVPVNSSFYPFQNPSTYVVGLVDAYATLQNGTIGKLDLCSVNHTLVMQSGLDAVSVLGGSIYVKEGGYSASPIVRNNTRFIVEKGAIGILYTVDAGATCIIDDFSLGRAQYYAQGVLQSDLNFSTGTLLLQSVNLTSLYCASIDQLLSGQGVKILHLIVENGTSFPAPPIDKQVFFRSDLGCLYVYNNSAWTPIGATPSTYPYANLTGVPQTFPYANLTGTPDLTVYLFANGTRALTGDWNIGGSYGVHGATWVNATNFAGSGQLWWNSQNRTDVVVNPLEAASYIVDAVGSTYRLKNCTTGQIDFRSNDVGAVLNNAIGNVTYGLIHVKSGFYTVKTTINLKGQITLEGDGMYSTQFILDNNANIDVMRWAPSGTEQFLELKDFAINGNKAQNTLGDGINFTGNTWDLTLYRVWIYNAAKDGMYVRNSAWGHRYFGFTIESCGLNGYNATDNSNAASFFGCRFASNSGSGVDLGTSSWAKWFFSCEFDSNTLLGLMIRGGSSHQVIGGRVTSNLGGGIQVWGTNHYFDGLYIASNTGYGIDIHGTSCQVQYCQFASNTVGPVSPGGTTMIIHYNLGYITENDGSATNVTATVFSFAHGLTAGPSAGHGGVWCSFSTTAVSGYTWIANATAINVTVTGTSLPATMTCYWKVEYVP